MVQYRLQQVDAKAVKKKMIIINSLLPAPVQKSSTVNNANHKNNYAPVAKGINIIKQRLPGVPGM